MQVKGGRAFVMGHPIGHSRSPLMHGHWLRHYGIPGSYEKLDVPPEALAAFFDDFDRAGWIGGNVTVPHKVAVMAFADRIDEAARAIGAVNTLWREDGALVGGNTDAEGFLTNLDVGAPGWDRPGGRVVILGAGGAARSAAYGCLTRGLSVVLVNRTDATAEALAAHFGAGASAARPERLPALLEEADAFVNTTSLGMQGKPPLDIDLSPMRAGAIVCDVVYVPLETDLLRRARGRGLVAVDGLGMLLYQGVEGFRRWFGVRPEVTPELRALVEADIRQAA